MKINITAGECLNKILEEKYINETFIPFNEAMIKGEYTTKLFRDEFIIERSIVHNVSIEKYKNKIHLFLEFLENVNNFYEVILWFGDEPFCKKNTEIVLQTLKEYNYFSKIILNIVVEETGEIISSNIINL